MIGEEVEGARTVTQALEALARMVRETPGSCSDGSSDNDEGCGSCAISTST